MLLLSSSVNCIYRFNIYYLSFSHRHKECMDKKCMFVTHSKSESETDGCARACTSKVNLFGMQTHARSSSHHIEMCMVIVTYLCMRGR